MKKLAVSLLFPVFLFLPALLSAQTNVLPGSGGTAGLPNPASLFCVQCGGSVQIQSAPQGETGICVLPGGLQIEEWTLWRIFNPQPGATP